jgi:hypothetical protein
MLIPIVRFWRSMWDVETCAGSGLPVIAVRLQPVQMGGVGLPPARSSDSLLMINGTRDTDMIKETSVDPLQRLAKEPKTFVWSETGHPAPTEEQRAASVQWLKEKVR